MPRAKKILDNNMGLIRFRFYSRIIVTKVLPASWVAVGISLLVAVFTLGHPFSRDTILHEMEKGMASAGVIILVTGGGGALGRIITDSGLGGYIANELAGSNILQDLQPTIIMQER